MGKRKRSPKKLFPDGTVKRGCPSPGFLSDGSAEEVIMRCEPVAMGSLSPSNLIFFCFFSAHPTFVSEVRSILRRIDSLLDALAERRAIPGSSYHLRCEEIFKLHYLGDSIQGSTEG